MDFRAEAERYCREYWDESDPATSEDVDRVEARLRYEVYRAETKPLIDAKVRIFAMTRATKRFISGESKVLLISDAAEELSPAEREAIAQIDVMIAITAKRCGITPKE